MACATALAAALPLTAASPDDAPAQAGALRELAWLAGDWRSPECEEYWSAPSEAGMVGVCRMEHGLKSPIYELLLIEREGATLVYRLRQFGPGMVEREGRALTLRLRESSARHAVFADPERDFPRQIEYRLAAPDELVIRLTGERNGAARQIEFRLKRS